VPANVVLANADPSGVPVDIPPSQGQQLAPAKASHRRRKEESPVGPPERLGFGVHGAQESLQLILVEEANVNALLDARPIDLGALRGGLRRSSYFDTRTSGD